MDFTSYSNPSLSQKKIDLVENVPLECSLNYKIHLNYHGILVSINASREAILKLILSLVPTSWVKNESSGESKLKLSLYSIRDFNISNLEWENETSSECLISSTSNQEIAIQRDFAGKMVGDNVVAIINEDIADGFFNILRWFMPRKLLQIKNTVLHSSCVVVDQKAHFFLGHSGYGKSTLTTLADEKLVLGDDMNILFQMGEDYYAKGAALGGLYNNKSILDQSYPVGAFYWLFKSSENKIEKMELAESYRKLISSCANIFWGESDSQTEGEMMKLATNVTRRYSFYNLYFSLDKGFWKYVK